MRLGLTSSGPSGVLPGGCFCGMVDEETEKRIFIYKYSDFSAYTCISGSGKRTIHVYPVLVK